MNSDFAKFLTENNQFFVIIFSGVSSIVATIALIASIISNITTKKQYKKGLEPQLSMKLECFDHELFLLVKNTGHSSACNISIKLNKLYNNGDYNTETTKQLFSSNFDLYPNEEVQDYVGIYGKNIINDAFPIAYLSVNYKHNKETTEYSRTVTYCRAYNKKIYADVNLDLSKTNESLRSISRSTVRTANYLDGKNLASFDEIDVLSNKSLKDDLVDITKGINTSNVLCREDTLDEALNLKKKKQ